jgi:adenosine deaminase
MCLLSNVHTGACASVEEHPFALFHRVGFRVCLNTDDRLMSDTSMTNELEIATRTFNLGLVDLEKMTMNAMKSAFIDHYKRIEIIHKRLLPSYATLFAELTERAFADSLRHRASA